MANCSIDEVATCIFEFVKIYVTNVEMSVVFTDNCVHQNEIRVFRHYDVTLFTRACFVDRE